MQVDWQNITTALTHWCAGVLVCWCCDAPFKLSIVRAVIPIRSLGSWLHEWIGIAGSLPGATQKR